MALQEQVIDIPLQMGLDLKEHEFLVDNARFLFLKDIVFDRGSLGQLHKRNGHIALPAKTCAITGYNSLQLNLLTPGTLAQFNNELDLVTGNVLYGQSENGWIPKGNLLAYTFSETQIASSVYSCSNPDMAVGFDFDVYAWEENSQVNVKVVDSTTGATYFQQGLIFGSITNLVNPKVISLPDYVVILVNDSSGNIYYSTLTSSQPISFLPLTLLVNIDESITAFDATICNGALILAILGQSGVTYTSYLKSYNISTFASISSATVATGTSVGKCICVATIGTNVLMGQVTFGNNASNVNAYFYSSALAHVQTLSSLNFGAYNGNWPHRITAINNDPTGEGTTDALLWIEQPPTSTTSVHQTVVYLLTSVGGATSFVPFVGMQLASQPFWQMYANPTKVTLNILATFPSQVQQTLFLMSDINEITAPIPGFVNYPMSAVGKAFEYNGGPAPTNNRLPAIQNGELFVCTNQTYLTSQAGQPLVVNGVSNVAYSVSQTVRGTQLGQNLLLTSGSLVYGYDGTNLVEHGFNCFPEAPVCVPLKSNITVITDVQPNQTNLLGVPGTVYKQASVSASTVLPLAVVIFTAVALGPAGNGIQVILTIGSSFSNTVSGNIIQVTMPTGTNPFGLVAYMTGVTAITNLISIAANTSLTPAVNAGTYILSGGTATPPAGSQINQQVNHIYIPDNPQNPGQALATTYTNQLGQKVSQPMITPGEYIIFNQWNINTGQPLGATSSVYAFVFIVDGNGGNWIVTTSGSPPVTTLAPPPGMSFENPTEFVPVCITSTMNATEVATQLYNAMTTNGTVSGFGDYTVTYNPIPQGSLVPVSGANPAPMLPVGANPGVTAWTPQFITVLGIANCALANPAMNRQFTALQLYASDPYGTPAAFAVNCCPANVISGGQYFTFGLSCATTDFNPALIQNGYVWFKVAGVGTDPNPFGYNATYNNIVPLPGIEISLLGTENEQQVASAIGEALAEIYPAMPPDYAEGYGVNVTFDGPSLIVTSVSTDARGIIPPDQWANNPNLVGVSHGYIDQNTTGVVNADSVLYSAVYEWTDAQGQLHQSPPSVPTVQYIFSYLSFPSWTSDVGNGPGYGLAVPPDQVFQVYSTPLNLTLKSKSLFPSTTNADIAFYRSQTNVPTVQYKITSPTNLIQMTPVQLNYPSFVDNQPDSPTLSNAQATNGVKPTTGISGNQPLYTTGGVLDNDAPPASTIIINHQDRIILASAEQPQTLWYSESWSYGLGIAFSEEQTIRFNAVVGQTVGGPITGFASVDGRLIIFQEDAIWYIDGSGPDATGAGQPFSTPQLVASSTAIGCRDPGSIALIPAGVMFKSNQGYYLLGRQLDLTPIGMPVQNYNADVVSSSVVLNNNTQVRFLSESGTTLVYDWFYQSWGSFSTQGISSILDSSTGLYTFLQNSGLVLQEYDGVYSDNNIPFSMEVTTAWIKLENIQGFARIWRAYLLGIFPGTEEYQIQFSYDYIDLVQDTIILNANAGMPVSGGAWGTDDATGVWGGSSSGYWGGEETEIITYPNRIQWKLYPQRQLCESIKITFQDTGVLDPTQTPALDALSFTCGVRKGGMKFLGNASTGG
jgi:hypothetical protein